MLNLKDHYVRERSTTKLKKMPLPFDVQLHKTHEVGRYYLLNAYRLMPNEESLRAFKNQPDAAEMLTR